MKTRIRTNAFLVGFLSFLISLWIISVFILRVGLMAQQEEQPIAHRSWAKVATQQGHASSTLLLMNSNAYEQLKTSGEVDEFRPAVIIDGTSFLVGYKVDDAWKVSRISLTEHFLARFDRAFAEAQKTNRLNIPLARDLLEFQGSPKLNLEILPPTLKFDFMESTQRWISPKSPDGLLHFYGQTVNETLNVRDVNRSDVSRHVLISYLEKPTTKSTEVGGILSILQKTENRRYTIDELKKFKAAGKDVPCTIPEDMHFWMVGAQDTDGSFRLIHLDPLDHSDFLMLILLKAQFVGEGRYKVEMIASPLESGEFGFKTFTIERL